MKRFIPALIIIVLIAVSCKEKNKETADAQKATVSADPAKDSAEIRQTVLGFYNWYHNNFRSFFRYNLYDGLKKEDEPPYKFNWDEAEKYQQFIRDSVPYLGQAFLENQQRFFKQCDSAFKVDIQDDIPYGFDYDWYTNSQEGTEYLLEDLHNPKADWNISVKGEEAAVRILMNRERGTETEQYTVISLSMKKENGKWTIAKIGNE